MKKSCDNCSAELSKLSLFNPNKKIYRYNNAILCINCYRKISSREQLKEEAWLLHVLLASDRPFTAFSASIFLSNLDLANKFSQLKVASLSVTNRSLKLKIKNFFSSDLKISSMSKINIVMILQLLYSDKLGMNFTNAYIKL
jgi:hypothetical protein